MGRLQPPGFHRYSIPDKPGKNLGFHPFARKSGDRTFRGRLPARVLDWKEFAVGFSRLSGVRVYRPFVGVG